MSDSFIDILDVADQILDMIISNTISVDQLNKINKLLENHDKSSLVTVSSLENLNVESYVSEFEKAIQDKTELDVPTYIELDKKYLKPMKELVKQSIMNESTYKKLLYKLNFMYDTYRYNVSKNQTPQNTDKRINLIIKMNKTYNKLTDEDKKKLPPPPNMEYPSPQVVYNKPPKRPSNKPSNQNYTRKKERYIDPLPTFDTLMKKMDEIIRTKLNTRLEDIKPFIEAIHSMNLTEEEEKIFKSKIMYIFMKDLYLDTKKLDRNTPYIKTLSKNTVDAYNNLSEQDQQLFEKIHTNLSTASEDNQPVIEKPNKSFDTYVTELEQYIHEKSGLDEAEYKKIVKDYLKPMEIMSKSNDENVKIYSSKQKKITYMFWLNRYKFLVKNNIKVDSVIMDTLNYFYDKLMNSDKQNLEKPPNILPPESSPNNKPSQQNPNSSPNNETLENDFVLNPQNIDKYKRLTQDARIANVNAPKLTPNYIEQMRQETRAIRSTEKGVDREVSKGIGQGIKNIETNVKTYDKIK